MHRVLALIVAVLLTMALAGPAAEAGHHSTATNVALGLASFAVFNQIVGPWWYPRPVYAYPPVVVERPVYTAYVTPYPYTSQVVVYATPPPPTQPTVVVYPHGRYVLRGDGFHTAYHWVWIPNPPPPPPAAPPAPTAPPSQ